MNRIAILITLYLKNNNIIPSNRFDECVYGLELILSTAFNTIILISIGSMAKKPLETIIIISVFYTLQTIGGGYHATSHLACLLTMVISLLVILGLIEINYLTMISIYTVPVVSFLLLFFILLVLHPNKDTYLQTALYIQSVLEYAQ